MGELRTVSVSVVLALCAAGWLIVVPLLLLQGDPGERAGGTDCPGG